MRSLAPYELMCAVLAGETPSTGLIRRAGSSSHELWRRALALEACAVHFDRALCQRRDVRAAIPPGLLRELSDVTAQAVRQALSLPRQIDEISLVARECGIQVMVLKGAARLLGGAIPGGRSLSDIDLLATPGDASRLYTVLCRRLGYQAAAAAPEHHLPTLSRVGALPIEVHVQLGPEVTALDARIWQGAAEVEAVGLWVPSPTAALLHALEHGALVHWAVRYRLRDLLDVAETWTADVDADETASYLRRHAQRVALETLLGAARRFEVRLPLGRSSAWRTVRRVARARHGVAAVVRAPKLAKSLCIAAGVLAEGSPRALLRPARLALFGVRQATVEV